MSIITTIPSTFRQLFMTFPLKTYSDIQETDITLESDIKNRTFVFQTIDTQLIDNEKKISKNNRFTLAIYNFFYITNTDNDNMKIILASDPWCLFSQLTLCKKNNLQLSTTQESTDVTNSGNRLALLSHHITQTGHLPIMIEDITNNNNKKKKRYMRSTLEINETLTNYITDTKLKLFALSLDTILYDAYIMEILYSLNSEDLKKLYYYYNDDNSNSSNESPIIDNIQSDIKKSLTTRNLFDVRNKKFSDELLSSWYSNDKRHNDLNSLYKQTLDNAKQLLTNLQDFIIQTEDDNTISSYFDLKLISYILCIENLPDYISLNSFLVSDCSALLHYCRTTFFNQFT